MFLDFELKEGRFPTLWPNKEPKERGDWPIGQRSNDLLKPHTPVGCSCGLRRQVRSRVRATEDEMTTPTNLEVFAFQFLKQVDIQEQVNIEKEFDRCASPG